MSRATYTPENQHNGALDELAKSLDAAINRLAEINAIEGVSPVLEIIEAARALMFTDEGLEALYQRVPAIEAAGCFGGSDWDYPQTLVPSLAVRTIRHGEPVVTLVESLSQIRLLAVAKGDYSHPSISAEHAQHFLAQVLAMNLDLVVSDLQESDRLRPDGIGFAVQGLYHFLLKHLGYENLLEDLVAEVWRILAQRPVQVDGVKQMVTQIAVCLQKPDALGGNVGDDALQLIHAVFTETSQCAYGLAMMLERGILYSPPVAPSLWRQIRLSLCETAAEKIVAVFGRSRSPECFLLADVLNVLGRPLGVGQGNYPTCQSTRALSMWAYNMPAELLRILAWAARDDEVVMRFEGNSISSRDLGAGLASEPPVDVDAVSLLTVPHLDRIYFEMGRRSAGRGEDPHKWVNSAFHGDHVGHGFRIAVDVFTGGLKDFEGFIRDFYAAYHPFYNGNIPVINPQPAGIAVTDSATRFLGWHAITIQRLALDSDEVMRVYFFNPNNDSGQNWGQGIVTSTQGHGELYGEASLPMTEFASRLYVFHYDPLEKGEPGDIPIDDVKQAMHLAQNSWALGRLGL